VVDVGDVMGDGGRHMCLVFQYENWEGTEFPYLRGWERMGGDMAGTGTK
jgi:hypothetical protein